MSRQYLNNSCFRNATIASALLSLGLVLAAPFVTMGFAAEMVGPDKAALDATRKKAIDFLKASQSDDGSWTNPTQPGISALVVTSLLRSGVPATDPAIAKGLTHLKTFVQPDGGIYHKDSGHRNYECCIAIMAFQEANAKGEYTDLIKKADKFVRDLQWDEGENQKPSDLNYGGAGYGRSRRPDLSNTQFLIEALKVAGAKPDDPALQKALVFVSRTQNLESEHNTTEFAAKINDGGFFYTPAAGGSSPAGNEPNGGLRSYGAMTYAGLKSMIYAGLKMEDPRVKAAYDWIRKFYSVKENPGMGQSGIYYYYQTFGKSLAVLDLDYIEDAKGGKHDWRKELADEVASKQLPNGSWVNNAERWQEGDPNLVTAYALLSLANCDPKPVSKTAK